MRIHNIIPTKEGASLSYYKEGEGQPIVFIHGFPEDATMWFDVMGKFSNQYKTIAIDLPGAGKSHASIEELSMEAMAFCIYEVLLYEHIEELLLVGHSMGGYVALEFLEKYNSMVKGMSMIHSTATPDTAEKSNTRLKAINIINKGGKDAFINQMIPNLFSTSFKKTNYNIVESLIKSSVKMKGESLVAFYNAMINRSNKSNILLDKDLPVQWIIGEDDMVTPCSTIIQHCMSTNVNFVSLYDNCAHMSMLEQKELLYKDLSIFFNYCQQ